MFSPETPNARPTWAEIDLEALAFNLRSARNFVGPDVKVMAMVKADAYGHGAVECSRRLETENVDWLGVALPEEGEALRLSGISSPILCVGGFWRGQERLIIENRLTPVVYQPAAAKALNQTAASLGVQIPVHVKVDTGMGRIGVRHDEFQGFAELLSTLTSLRVEGLMTHFAAADDLNQNDFTNSQIDKFYDALEKLKARGLQPEYVDLANSPGAVGHPNGRGNMVRLGGILYGLVDDVLPKGIDKPELRPVMALYSRIAHLKSVPAGETLGYGRTFRTERASLIATVPIGYQDGYRRALSNRARVLINSAFAPVVGRISMDWTIVDVTDVANASIGDQVVFIGASGDLTITAGDLAQMTDTISYEITCAINPRVPRRFSARE